MSKTVQETTQEPGVRIRRANAVRSLSRMSYAVGDPLPLPAPSGIRFRGENALELSLDSVADAVAWADKFEAQERSGADMDRVSVFHANCEWRGWHVHISGWDARRDELPRPGGRTLAARRTADPLERGDAMVFDRPDGAR